MSHKIWLGPGLVLVLLWLRIRDKDVDQTRPIIHSGMSAGGPKHFGPDTSLYRAIKEHTKNISILVSDQEPRASRH